MNSGQFDAAHEVVGEFTLGEIRRGFLVGIAVHKLLSPPRPAVPKPSGPTPSGSPLSSGILEKRATFLEEESDLDRLMRLAKRKRIYH